MFAWPQLKKKLKGERAEREKEQNDHGLMIREMQKLVTTERMAKEHIEQQVSLNCDDYAWLPQ